VLNKIVKNKVKIHTRDIKLATYSHTKSRVIVHGILKDQRYIRIFDVTGDVLEPGIIHHMDVKIMIKSDPLIIENIQAEMLNVPMNQCRTTLNNVKNLKGLEIKSGFTRIVRSIIGGKTGCTHLCNLIITMAQEIIHGWLTQKRKKIYPVPKNIESLAEKEFLIDSCRMWTNKGPKIKNLERAIQAQKKNKI